MIYLDNNASTKLDPEVRAAMEASANLFGNPSSVHSEGRRARRAVEEARDEVARLIEARPEEVFFTSGGTEANAMALFGVTEAGGRVVRSGAEHPSVREPLSRLAAGGSVEEEVVNPEPSGRLDAARVRAALSEGARLVSVMLANNEYGAIYPVAAIAAAARARGALVHTDAVQAAGRIPISVGELGVDLLVISGHKFHGPKGAGALFIRRGVTLVPRTPGGGQEKRMRAGTENTAAIVGLGVAARLARQRLASDASRVETLRDRLEEAVLGSVRGSRIIGREAPRLPNTSAIAFEQVSGEDLLIRLDLEGIAVSVGSACSSGTLAPSPALLSLGLSRAEAKGVVRFSLSRETTSQEVETAARTVARVVGEMRSAILAVTTGAARGPAE